MSRRRGRGGMPPKSDQVTQHTGPVGVTVTVAQPQQININVDLDRLRWEHAEMMQRVSDPTTPPEEQSKLVLDVLNVVTGQDMSQQPLRVVNAVLDQIKIYFGAGAGN